MPDYKFEIIEHIATLSKRSNEWTKEVNIVSWNGGKAKLDVREWSPNHSKPGRGVTLSKEETCILEDALNSLGL